MKKSIILPTVALAIITLSAPVFAGDFELMPVFNNNYEADFSVAILGGETDFDISSSHSAQGLEVAFNCPLLKPDNHVIRQQLSYIKTDNNGIETHSFEANPHHMFKIADQISIGAGPSIGITKVKTANKEDSVLTYGLGASAQYDLGNQIFLGAEAVYAKSRNVSIPGISDLDKTRVMGKIGFKFF